MQCVLQILDKTIKTIQTIHTGIGNRVNGMNGTKKGMRNESMSVCGHQVFVKICIRCYSDSAILYVSYLWPFLLCVLYLFARRLHCEECAHCTHKICSS